MRADLTDPATWTKLDYPLQKSGMYNGEWQLGTGHGIVVARRGRQPDLRIPQRGYDNGRYGGRDAQVLTARPLVGRGHCRSLDMQRDEELNPAYAGITMEIAVR